MPCTSEALPQAAHIHDKATPQDYRVPSCKPYVSVQSVVILRRPVCNRWPILPASPRRFSSQSYEVRCVPVSDNVYYTKKRRGAAADSVFGDSPISSVGVGPVLPVCKRGYGRSHHFPRMFSSRWTISVVTALVGIAARTITLNIVLVPLFLNPTSYRTSRPAFATSAAITGSGERTVSFSQVKDMSV